MSRKRQIGIVGAASLAVALMVLGALFSSTMAPTPMAATYRPTMLPHPPREFEIKVPSVYPAEGAPEPVAVWLPGDSKRLAIVISGLVGNSTDGLSYTFSEPFRRRGFSVLILPSPSHWTFALHLMPKDRRTSYTESVAALCRSIESVLTPEVRGRLSQVVMTGYSLGARHAISTVPCAQLLFPSAQMSVMAMNPPTNLSYAAATLDRLLAESRKRVVDLYLNGFSIGVLGTLSGAVVSSASSPSELRRSLDFFLRPFFMYEQSLKELAAASFAVRLEPILTGVENPGYRLQPERESFSFAQILVDAPLSMESFLEEIHRSPLYRRGANDSISVIHSRDDFLVTPREVDRLIEELGPPSRAFDRGGHVGLVFEPLFEEWFEAVEGTRSR